MPELSDWALRASATESARRARYDFLARSFRFRQVHADRPQEDALSVPQRGNIRLRRRRRQKLVDVLIVSLTLTQAPVPLACRPGEDHQGACTSPPSRALVLDPQDMAVVGKHDPGRR
jgi:hypothetical protein